MDLPKVMLHVYDVLIPEGLREAFIKACQGTQMAATPVALPSSTPVNWAHRLLLMCSSRNGCRFPMAAE